MPTLGDILLVEDELALANLLRRVLMRAGFTVRVETDGTHALVALAQEMPAVLVLDLLLPGMNGFSVLDYIQQHQLPLPIIVITGIPLAHPLLSHAGIKHVLVKPFGIEELLVAIHAVIGSPPRD